MASTERTYGSFSPRPRARHGDTPDSPCPPEPGPTEAPDDHVYPDARGAPFLSRVFFAWFDPLVEIASRRRVEVGDIWNLPADVRCERAYEEFLAAYKVTGSLLWSIARCYWPYFLRSSVLSCAGVAFSIAHPLLLYAVIKIAMQAKHGEGVVVIMLLLVCILVAKIASVAFKRHSLQVLLIASTKAVGAIATLLFDRAISVPSTPGGDSASSISSADASFLLHELGKIYHVLTIIHMPWVYTVHITANLYILYSIIGDAFVVSIMSAIVAQLIAGHPQQSSMDGSES